MFDFAKEDIKMADGNSCRDVSERLLRTERANGVKGRNGDPDVKRDLRRQVFHRVTEIAVKVNMKSRWPFGLINNV